ncbi:MAG: cytochrome c peroxidase [Flavobacteriales bacterium]
MNHPRYSVLLLLLGSTLFFGACSKDAPEQPNVGPSGPHLPAIPFDYTIPQLPPSFNSGLLALSQSTPADNPITNAGATLGRALFYEREMSISRTISCGSCHHQDHGFADGHATSVGHAAMHTRRNAMHLVNQMYSRRQFWDLRAATLEDQVLMPIQDAVEMGMPLEGAMDRLREEPYYPALFTAAFGSDSITPDRVSKALAQFVRSIVSYRSKFDEGEASGFTNYTQEESDGKALFYNGATRCNQCHVTVNFANQDARNNGLDPVYTDNGRGEITGNPADDGQFKVPSLRNVELSAPYMHDGRFNTLEEVVEHYNSGIKAHPDLDDRLTVEGQIGGTPLHMDLSDYDKAALVAFLKTLTDEPLVHDPRFSDPFPH